MEWWLQGIIAVCIVSALIIFLTVIITDVFPTLADVIDNPTKKRAKKKNKPDGELHIDLLSDSAPLDLKLDISLGDLLDRKQITLKVIDLNAGMSEDDSDDV